MLGTHFSWNGKLRDASEAQIGLDDLDFASGYGIYETLRVRQGELFFCEDHESRLFHSAEVLGLALRWNTGALCREIRGLLENSDLPDANVRVLVIGRGDGTNPDRNDHVVFLVEPPSVPASAPGTGVQCILGTGERAFPAAKSLNLLVSRMAYQRAQAAGAYDALLVAHDDVVTEGTRTSLLWEQDGQILTTVPERALRGVTLLHLERELAALNIAVERGLLDREQLLGGAVPLWISSTSTGIVPVRRVDDAELPARGLLTPVLQNLRSALGYR